MSIPGLLSGMYQQQLACYWNNDLWKQNGWELPDQVRVLPEVLKTAGYVCGHIGKWNISEYAEPYFDEAYDVMLWQGAYYPEESGNYPGVGTGDFNPEPHGWGPARGASYIKGYKEYWPPTLLGPAGPLNQAMYGVSLLPYLEGDMNESPHDTLYWLTHNQAAVRAGDWKQILEQKGRIKLFDLENPDVVESLIKSIQNWNNDHPPPLASCKKLDFSKHPINRKQ